jgi:cell division protein FtsX
VLLAARHALRPDGDSRRVVGAFLVLTLLVGVLGTVAGYQVSVRHIEQVPPDQRWIVLIGLSEALNNLVAALFLAALQTLIAAGAVLRRVDRAPV